MAIIVTGFGRHGKDVVSEYLALKTGLRFHKSTSLFAADVVWEMLKNDPSGYPDVPSYTTSADCFADRAQHRPVWAELIAEYNGPDYVGLYREMVKTHDILCGIRRIGEMRAVQKYQLADLAIWVDASSRMPDDPTCTITSSDCDFVIDNNGSLEDLYSALDNLIPRLQCTPGK